MQRRVFKNFPGTVGHKGLIIPAFQQKSAHSGGGRVFKIGKVVVIAAAPVNGQRLHGATLTNDGFAVFHTEDVVGAAQNTGIHLQFLQRSLTGRRKGFSRVQMTAEQGRKVRGQQGCGGSDQCAFVSGFRAEAKLVAEAAQDLHTAGGKALRRGKDTGDGQLQHQIRATAHRGGCTEGFVDDGRAAPLNEIAAHETDDGSILPQQTANCVKLLHMTLMQGVIFTDNTDRFQKTPSFFKFFLFRG